MVTSYSLSIHIGNHFSNIVRGHRLIRHGPQVRNVPCANQDNYLPDFRSSNNNILFKVNLILIDSIRSTIKNRDLGIFFIIKSI